MVPRSAAAAAPDLVLAAVAAAGYAAPAGWPAGRM